MHIPSGQSIALDKIAHVKVCCQEKQRYLGAVQPVRLLRQ